MSVHQAFFDGKPATGHGKITRIACTTTAAADPFTLEINHDWSPVGAERFVNLVKDGFFTDVAFFRCVENFLCQFGISPDAASDKKRYWRLQGGIQDDPTLGIEFKRGMISFAGGGPNSRTTQLFITFADLNFLGKPEAPWETPLGVVTEGMEDVVDKLYKGYRDQQPFNTAGVNQQTLMQRGNEYLSEEFPLLSYFKECKVVGDFTYPEASTIEAATMEGVSGVGHGGTINWAEPSAAVKLPEPSFQQMIRESVPAGKNQNAEAGSFNILVFAFAALILGFGSYMWTRSKKDGRLEN